MPTDIETMFLFNFRHSTFMFTPFIFVESVLNGKKPNGKLDGKSYHLTAHYILTLIQ